MTKRIINKAQKFYESLDKLGKWKEGLLVWAFFSILVFGFVVLTGTFTSGFHLVDDWEYAKYVDQMHSESLWQCIKETIDADLQLRFRPLYFVNRVCIAAVFGINLMAMSAVKAIEIILALGFLYYCARLLKCNVVYAMLFSLTVMVGYQSAVWWKLGPQESFGIMVFAMGFYCLLKWFRTERKWYALVSVFLFFLMSIYKESFILLLPFVMLYVVYEQMKGQKVTIANFWNSVKTKLPYLVCIGIIFAAEMLLIVFVIGTNNYSYVGLDSKITLSEYQDIWGNVFRADLKWYVRFGTLFLMIVLTYWEQLKKLGWEILLTLSIVIPQVVIYSKSAITERYILPAVFGFAFFFVVVGCNWKALSGKRRIVYMLGLLLMLAAHGRAAVVEANYFTYRGNGIQEMLETTLQYTKENEEVSVLSCLGPNIEGNLTMKYWMKLHGFDNVYYWKEDFWKNDEVHIYKELDEEGNYSLEEGMLENMDIIVMYNREDRHWCYEPDLNLDLSDYTEEKCDTLTMFIKNK